MLHVLMQDIGDGGSLYVLLFFLTLKIGDLSLFPLF